MIVHWYSFFIIINIGYIQYWTALISPVHPSPAAGRLPMLLSRCSVLPSYCFPCMLFTIKLYQLPPTSCLSVGSRDKDPTNQQLVEKRSRHHSWCEMPAWSFYSKDFICIGIYSFSWEGTRYLFNLISVWLQWASFFSTTSKFLFTIIVYFLLFFFVGFHFDDSTSVLFENDFSSSSFVFFNEQLINPFILLT